MKNPPIAKITRPKLAGAYPRKRLFKLLDQYRGMPVTWISSPAGSGKTTLVASYLDARKLTCIWYQLDEGDNDPATFFYYLGLAARKAAPRHKKPLPLLTPEYLANVRIFSRRFFENLCARLKTPFVLVFDNYHEVAQDSTLHEIFIEGLSALPEGVRVIVISRTDPPQPFASLLAAQRLALLGWEELKLAPEESKGIVRIEGGRTLTPTAIEQLHEKAHGWAAGLLLMTKSAQYEKGPAPYDLELRPPEEVFDYFANELFDRAEQRIRDFLLKTSFLPQMTISAAAALTGFREAERILARLYHDNHFTEKRYQSELVYQYHPLFRQFLMNHARADYAPAMLARLKTRAAGILEASGRIEDAAELLVNAADREKLAALILNHAESLARQGRYSTLGKWLSNITPDVLERAPWLLYWRGISSLTVDPGKSLADFEKAFAKFRKQKDITGLFLSWAGVVESIWYAFEDMSRLGRWIAVFNDLITQYGKRVPSEIEARAASILLKILIQTRFNSPDFEHWRGRAVSARDRNTKIEALLNSAAHYVFNGELAKAESVLQSLNVLLRSPGVGPLQHLQGILHKVLIYALSGSYARCVEAVAQGIDIADRSGVHMLDLLILGNGLVAALNYDDVATVKVFSARLPADSAPMRPWDRSFCHFLRALEQTQNGAYDRAGRHAYESVLYADEVGFPASRVWCRLAHVLVLHEQNERSRAEQLLQEACRIARDFGGALLAVDCRFLEAHVWAGTFPDKALRSLRQALTIGKEKGLMVSFIPLPSASMSRLCATALEYGIEPEYVRQIIRTRKLVPEQNSLHLDRWPWPYRIFAMGTFRILKDDKPLGMPAKTPKKPLELLKALIAFGGTDVSEQRITDALWPDNAGDAAHSVFTTTLQRLRQLLGSDKVIVVQDGRVSIDRRYVWVDAWAFERMLGHDAEQGMWNAPSPSFSPPGGEGGGEGRIHNPQSEIQQGLEKALRLYSGHFLSGDGDKPWAISRRERLRSKYLRAVGALGKIHEQAGKYAKAVEVYLRGLDVDDLAEEFYQRLMECHHRMGRKAEAVRVYERCRSVLKAALGVEPGDETRRITEWGSGSIGARSGKLE